MRGKLSLLAGVAVLFVVAIAGIASAEKPVPVQTNQLEPHMNAGVAPKAVSKTRLTPATLGFSWEATADDGFPPPALSEFVLKTDRDMTLDLKGYPTCRPLGAEGPLSSWCHDALIGHGRIDVYIAFPGAEVIHRSSRLLIFKGGKMRGAPTIWAVAFLTEPTPATIVIVGTIRRSADGHYGTEVAFRFPTIDGSAGSVTSFSAQIHKEYLYKGARHSVVRMKCPDKVFFANGQATFADGTVRTEKDVRTCTGTS